MSSFILYILSTYFAANELNVIGLRNARHRVISIVKRTLLVDADIYVSSVLDLLSFFAAYLFFNLKIY